MIFSQPVDQLANRSSVMKRVILTSFFCFVLLFCNFIIKSRGEAKEGKKGGRMDNNTDALKDKRRQRMETQQSHEREKRKWGRKRQKQRVKYLKISKTLNINLCLRHFLQHLVFKPLSSSCFMCMCARPRQSMLTFIPFRDLLRLLLSSNPISSNPSLPFSSYIVRRALSLSHTQKHTCSSKILSFRPAAIHVVGLLLSLLWIHTHKTPWTLLPQDYTQWHLGKDACVWECLLEPEVLKSFLWVAEASVHSQVLLKTSEWANL